MKCPVCKEDFRRAEYVGRRPIVPPESVVAPIDIGAEPSDLTFATVEVVACLECGTELVLQTGERLRPHTIRPNSPEDYREAAHHVAVLQHALDAITRALKIEAPTLLLSCAEDQMELERAIACIRTRTGGGINTTHRTDAYQIEKLRRENDALRAQLAERFYPRRKT